MVLSLSKVACAFRTVSRALVSAVPNVRRVAVVADLDNISIGLANNGLRPDWRALYNFASARGQVVAAHAFGELRTTSGYQSFIGALGKIGYNVHLTAATAATGWRKAAPVDHDLIATTMALLIDHKIDEIFLASGDGDFLPLIDQLQERGVRVTIVSPDGCTSRRLAAEATAVVPFTKVGATRLNATVPLNRRPAIASAQ